MVDDRPDGLMTLEAVLKSMDYNLVKASSGLEALTRILELEFALVILDVQMPGMDGFETAALIKQREKTRHVPIIFVTAIHKSPQFIHQGYGSGAVDYLFKPFDPYVLRAKVSVFIDLYRKEKLLHDQALRLRRSEERNRLILQAARDIIMTTDRDGAITSLSPSFEALTGWHSFDWLGKHLTELFHADDSGGATQLFARAQEEEVAAFQTRVRKSNGDYFFAELSARHLSQEGKVIGTMSIIRDVSERLQAEEEKKRRQELERSNKELERFAYVCSHDLQEPLRIAKTYAQLLEAKARQMDSETTYIIAEIIHSTERMSHLIHDVLDYARLGSSDVYLEEIDCSAVLNDVRSNIRLLMDETGAQISECPFPEIYGNHSQLVQLFQNLISNSIKFKGASPPQITIQVEDKEGEWVFCVRDNGVGFQMRYAQQIFEMFKKIPLREDRRGTGVGLAICRRIVERHGGRIWAESEPGQGSQFFFTLPKKRPNSATAGRAPRAPIEAGDRPKKIAAAEAAATQLNLI